MFYSSLFSFFSVFFYSFIGLIKLVFINNKLLLGDNVYNLSIILEDFCLSSTDCILLDISGNRALWNCWCFMFIFTKLNGCAIFPNSFIANKFGFDFGVGLTDFLIWLVILKLFKSFFSSD